MGMWHVITVGGDPKLLALGLGTYNKRITLATPMPPIDRGGVGARTIPLPRFASKKGIHSQKGLSHGT